MLTAYNFSTHGPTRCAAADGPPATAGWVDLLNPDAGEDSAAETFLGASIPTMEEAQEIESSSRFYLEGGAVYLNLALLVGLKDRSPTLSPLSFVLKGDRIVTVRHVDSAAFNQFLQQIAKPEANCSTASAVLLRITDAIIDRSADAIEKAGADVDRINGQIFGRRQDKIVRRVARERRLEAALQEIAYQEDVISKCRESMTSIERMLQFIMATEIAWADRKADRERLKLLARDVRSLTDQLAFLSSRTSFLLDATLGLISVEQNDVIRVLTVAAAILLPPTLIGTIYGMNFTVMPELDWRFGYPLAVGVMILAGVVPYLILKRRGWF